MCFIDSSCHIITKRYLFKILFLISAGCSGIGFLIPPRICNDRALTIFKHFLTFIHLLTLNKIIKSTKYYKFRAVITCKFIFIPTLTRHPPHIPVPSTIIVFKLGSRCSIGRVVSATFFIIITGPIAKTKSIFHRLQALLSEDL